MNEMTILERKDIVQQDFSESLFNDFVAWINRSPRTTRTYLGNLKQFAAWLRYMGISSPTRKDIIAYRDWLISEHDCIRIDGSGWSYRTDTSGNRIRMACTASTTSQYLRIVAQFFSWTSANGLYPNIAVEVHPPKVNTNVHRKLALTPDQVITVEDSIQARSAEKTAAAAAERKDTAGRIQRSDEQGKRLYAIYLLAVNVGLRTIEISRANVRDFTTIDGRAWIYIYGKGHSEADDRKPLAPAVADAVRDYLDSRHDNYSGLSPLFVATGNRSGGKRLATTTISTMLKKAMQQAGYDDPRITAHSLRHAAGSAAMEVTGDNLYKTQQYLRHKNPRTTEVYLHQNVEKSDADIADRLYDYYHGGSQQTESLTDILKTLTPEQLAVLTAAAKAMT